jgi:hypothetical protein
MAQTVTTAPTVSTEPMAASVLAVRKACAVR